jgi:hypothetical protein
MVQRTEISLAETWFWNLLGRYLYNVLTRLTLETIVGWKLISLAIVKFCPCELLVGMRWQILTAGPTHLAPK